MKKTKIEDEEVEVDAENPINGFISEPNMRLLHLYGAVDEKKANAIVYSMFAYSRIKKLVPKPGEVITANSSLSSFNETLEPMEFLLSTPGGTASDMFSIYDTMKLIQDDPGLEIHTIGVGRVMSAGVLLIAAGTKGKRKIGRNCRVMIHSVIGGAMGSTHDIKNEIKELFNTERAYIKALAKETKMTPKQIREFLDEKRNIYLSASEAVKLGIADIIV